MDNLHNTDKKRKIPLRVMIILAFMAVGWLLVFPIGVIRDTEISRTAADYSMNTGPVGEVAAIQEFVPAYGRLRSLGVDIGKLDGKADQGTLYLEFFDADLNAFASILYDIHEMNDGTLTDIPVNLKLKAGERYFVSVRCEDTGDTPPVLHYRSKAGNGPEENLNFYYGPSVIEDASANIRYIYEIPLNLGQILFYDSLILLVGVVLMWMTGSFRHNGSEEKEENGI